MVGKSGVRLGSFEAIDEGILVAASKSSYIFFHSHFSQVLTYGSFLSLFVVNINQQCIHGKYNDPIEPS